MISQVKTILTFKRKDEALKFHLFAVAKEEGIKLSTSDIDVIVEIYNNGYTQDIYPLCVEKKYFKSEQAVRNCVARLSKIGILEKARGHRKVNPIFLPELSNDDIIFSYDVIYTDFTRK